MFRVSYAISTNPENGGIEDPAFFIDDIDRDEGLSQVFSFLKMKLSSASSFDGEYTIWFESEGITVTISDNLEYIYASNEISENDPENWALLHIDGSENGSIRQICSRIEKGCVSVRLSHPMTTG